VLLSASKIAKAYGGERVLLGADVRVEKREKVALVGRNAIGKTTLIRIITGEEEPDAGSVHLSPGARIGYLRQVPQAEDGSTVLGEAERGRAEVIGLRRRLRELEEIPSNKITETEIEEFAALHERLLDEAAYSIDHDLRSVLSKVGFSEADFDKPISALSGGERTRLALARLLLEEPELLILDEPTNHLDLEATEWLEKWIREYHGAALIVSHDREFLQNVADRIVEIESGISRSWPGPFDKFIRLREEDAERRSQIAERQAKAAAKLDEFVRRFLNSERVAQARGRQKHLRKLQSEMIEKPKSAKSMTSGFGKVARSGDLVAACKNVAMFFGDRTLYSGLDWTVLRGERWGVVGSNGSGKSTLIKNLLSIIEPTGGEVRIGSNVTVGYFSQDASDIDPAKNPLEFLNYECGLDYPTARTLLGRFLISGEQAFQPIGTLSGGERNKLALARLTALKPNLLVLDEPTNHLDMDSREALADVLADFAGTLILVSHDRRLLDRLTTKTLDLRNGVATTYLGSYRDYRAGNREASTQSPTKNSSYKMTPREISKNIEKLQREVETIEQEIVKLEQDVEAKERDLGELPENADFHTKIAEYSKAKEALAAKVHEWEEAGASLEEIRSMQGVSA
jgi:ATP-binding cassette subfamily F protein 3